MKQQTINSWYSIETDTSGEEDKVISKTHINIFRIGNTVGAETNILFDTNEGKKQKRKRRKKNERDS